MKKIFIINSLLVILLVSSCKFSSLIGDKDLKSGYIFTADGDQACIIFSPSIPYRGTGLLVIPAKVVEVKYDKNYIIAKSIDKGKSEMKYWIIYKSISIDLNNCTDQTSCDSVLMSNVEGPLDSVLFNKILKENSIPLSFDN